MPLYARESLEALKTKVDLVDVVSPYVEMKRSGASYKACCPFHEEKSPSFIIQKGNSHYHCFGCGAHGDSISFLMNHLSMNFSEAVEHLAERFDVSLQKINEGDTQEEWQRKAAKKALADAAAFFHFYLLHTPDGHQVLDYLYQRGIDLAFICQFQVGFAPGEVHLLTKTLGAMGHTPAVLETSGLLMKQRELFLERITFPIKDALGHVIGFSARKIREETFGGKYVNTPETTLFKKGHHLFGLNYSRHRMAKEHRALLVEGQIDALRLIQEGFDFTVASQGTALTETQARLLVKLGVKKVILAFDGDAAGIQAALKAGDLFARLSLEVAVVRMPSGMDPDSFILAKGRAAFEQCLQEAEDFLTFLVRTLGKEGASPAAKAQLAQGIKEQIQAWPDPLLVHESLKKLASLLQVPEETVGLTSGQLPAAPYQKKTSLVRSSIDPIKVLETDLLRLLLCLTSEHENEKNLVFQNVKKEFLQHPGCREIFEVCFNKTESGEMFDLLSVAASLNSDEGTTLVNEILQKKINLLKLKEVLRQVVQKIIERQWMMEAEVLRIKIQSLNHSEEEALKLAKELAALRKNPPQVRD